MASANTKCVNYISNCHKISLFSRYNIAQAREWT